MTDPTSEASGPRRRRGRARWLVAAALAGLVLGSLAVPAGATGGTAANATATTAPAIVVELHADGSARMAVTAAYDLSTAADREAFDRLRTNESRQAQLRERFLTRMRAVADGTSRATGREMAVDGAEVGFGTTAGGRTGVLTLSVAWAGLAAAEDGRLVVSEPFASGFAPDRRFLIRSPDGYAVAAASPEPSARNGTDAAWDASTDLGGLRVAFEPEEASTPTGATTAGSTDSTATRSTAAPATGTTTPGFGALVTLLAVLVFFVAAAGRQSA